MTWFVNTTGLIAATLSAPACADEVMRASNEAAAMMRRVDDFAASATQSSWRSCPHSAPACADEVMRASNEAAAMMRRVDDFAASATQSSWRSYPHSAPACADEV